MTVPRNIRRQWRHRHRKMITNNTTTTTEASAEDRRHVQGIGDNGGGGSWLTMGPADWQRQQSVDFPCYCVANSNTVSSMSRCCLVLILFSSDYFFRSLKKILSVLKSRGKYFLYQVYTDLAYVSPTYRRVKKLWVLMINKNVYKSLARKKGNDIIICN